MENNTIYYSRSFLINPFRIQFFIEEHSKLITNRAFRIFFIAVGEEQILNIVKKNIRELEAAAYNPRKDLQPGDPEY